MNVESLVTMANRIGDFFSAYPDRVQAEADIADHLRKFWEPRMRRTLLAHIDADGGSGLSPIVRDAVVKHRVMLSPRLPDQRAG